MNNMIKSSNDKQYQILNIKLIKMLKEQFNLRMQMKSGEFKQFHLLKKVRRSIAFVKTQLFEIKNLHK